MHLIFSIFSEATCFSAHLAFAPGSALLFVTSIYFLGLCMAAAFWLMCGQNLWFTRLDNLSFSFLLQNMCAHACMSFLSNSRVVARTIVSNGNTSFPLHKCHSFKLLNLEVFALRLQSGNPKLRQLDCHTGNTYD